MRWLNLFRKSRLDRQMDEEFEFHLNLLADPYPGFLGDGAYPVDLVVAPPERQSRWITAFRAILAIPAWIVANVLGLLLQVLAVIAWFIGVFAARIPEGLRDLGAFCLRFQQQTWGYVVILTDRYPSFGYRRPDPAGGPDIPASRELVRFALPRRVYTANHLAYVAEVAESVVAKASSITGYRVVRQQGAMRQFTALLAPVYEM